MKFWLLALASFWQISIMGKTLENITLVETVPIATDLEQIGEPTNKALVKLIDSAQKQLAIAAMYWNLLAKSQYFSQEQLQKLGIGKKKGLMTRVGQTMAKC